MQQLFVHKLFTHSTWRKVWKLQGLSFIYFLSVLMATHKTNSTDLLEAFLKKGFMPTEGNKGGGLNHMIASI